MQWSKIETAPRDGTKILVHDKKTGVMHVSFWNGYDWHDPDSHYYNEAPDLRPTMWAPIQPPKAEE